MKRGKVEGGGTAGEEVQTLVRRMGELCSRGDELEKNHYHFLNGLRRHLEYYEKRIGGLKEEYTQVIADRRTTLEKLKELEKEDSEIWIYAEGLSTDDKKYKSQSTKLQKQLHNCINPILGGLKEFLRLPAWRIMEKAGNGKDENGAKEE